jgi:hypothetical protein
MAAERSRGTNLAVSIYVVSLYNINKKVHENGKE